MTSTRAADSGGGAHVSGEAVVHGITSVPVLSLETPAGGLAGELQPLFLPAR